MSRRHRISTLGQKDFLDLLVPAPAPPPSPAPVHCDVALNDPKRPECLRRWLRFARLPPGQRRMLAHEGISRPRLYATLRAPVEPLRAGLRVRLVSASAKGHVGISPDLHGQFGQGSVAQVMVDDLAEFADTP